MNKKYQDLALYPERIFKRALAILSKQGFRDIKLITCIAQSKRASSDYTAVMTCIFPGRVSVEVFHMEISQDFMKSSRDVLASHIHSKCLEQISIH